MKKIADFFEMLEITGKISPSIEGRGLWEWNGEKDLIVAIYDPGLDVQDFAKSKQGQGMALIISYMKKLIDNMRIPHSFKGVTPGILNPIQRMFIYMNIVEPIDMNDKYVKLLKMVNTRGQSFETTQEDFQTPTYLPLRKGDISWIEVLIANETGEPVSFQTGTVVLTLHFRKAVRARFSKRF